MKELKVFEAFSGIGAQKRALDKLNINFEVVGTSENDVNAIISYAAIHCNLNDINSKKYITKDINEIKKYLERLNLKRNGRKLNLENIDQEEIKNIYIACKLSNNYGDILNISEKSLPDIDLLTYSFPCQDISSVGTQLGFKKGSETRSSLLWETKKIIEFKKPKFLLMENVASLVNKNHKPDFNLWIDYLEKLGYTNSWEILDSQDFGIPQRRKRVFMVSILNGQKYDFSNIVKKEDNINILNFLEKNQEYTEVYDYNNPDIGDKKVKQFNMKDGETKFWDDRDWKRNGIMIQDVCSTQRAGRSGLKCVKRFGNKLKVRRLTPGECLTLMGFTMDDYVNMKNAKIADTNILKQSGNSIVVDVLEAIFSNMLKDNLKDNKVGV